MFRLKRFLDNDGGSCARTYVRRGALASLLPICISRPSRASRVMQSRRANAFISELGYRCARQRRWKKGPLQSVPSFVVWYDGGRRSRRWCLLAVPPPPQRDVFPPRVLRRGKPRVSGKPIRRRRCALLSSRGPLSRDAASCSTLEPRADVPAPDLTEGPL